MTKNLSQKCLICEQNLLGTRRGILLHVAFHGLGRFEDAGAAYELRNLSKVSHGF